MKAQTSGGLPVQSTGPRALDPFSGPGLASAAGGRGAPAHPSAAARRQRLGAGPPAGLPAGLPGLRPLGVADRVRGARRAGQGRGVAGARQRAAVQADREPVRPVVPAALHRALQLHGHLAGRVGRRDDDARSPSSSGAAPCSS